MVPRIVHQIYWSFDGKTKLNDISEFRESVQKTEKYCIENDIKHILWDYEKCNKLIDKYPEQRDLWNDFDKPIQKVDFIRYLILYDQGGIYLDCDVFPIRSMEQLFLEDIFLAQWASDDKNTPYNAIMGSIPKHPFWEDIFVHCKESFYEKREMEIYKTWKARYIFHTTGHCMIKRVMNQKKHKNKIKLIKCVSVWNNCKNICDIPDADKAVFFDCSRSYWYKDNSMGNA